MGKSGKALSLAKDMYALTGLLREKFVKKPAGPIKVAFLCQFIPVWHKLKPIYEIMKEDDRFDPVLICVPSGIKEGELLDPDCRENDTYDFFVSHGYSEAVNALQEDGSWLDLQQLGLTYIFYPRPYNSFMPKQYGSRIVSRYCKICLIFYGMNTTEEIVDITLTRTFFRYVHCYFAELPYARERNERNGWLGHKLGLQKSVYYGMPGIEELRKSKGTHSPSWDFSHNSFRVIWTPRWTTDLAQGGSNFFTYYKMLLDYAQENKDMDFLFRPHPLALSHFLETGEMTQEEVDAFIERCEKLPNVMLDKEKEYAASMWETSVLVSDTSGIIPEYFMMDKPLIFCASNMILTPEPFTKRVLEGCYCVYDQQELVRCLEMLKRGEDPLAEKRSQIVQELFGKEYDHPARSAVEALAGKSGS